MSLKSAAPSRSAALLMVRVGDSAPRRRGSELRYPEESRAGEFTPPRQKLLLLGLDPEGHDGPDLRLVHHPGRFQDLLAPRRALQIEAEARPAEQGLPERPLPGPDVQPDVFVGVDAGFLLGQADGHGQSAELVDELDILGLAAGPDAALAHGVDGLAGE